MSVVEGVLKLLSKLPPEAYQLFTGMVNALLSSDKKTALANLRKAALAAGYKAGAKEAMDAALAARKKLNQA